MPKVERLPSGSFRIRYTDPWGRRAVVTRQTAADCRAAHRQIVSAMARGDYIDPRRARTTVAEWAHDWLEGARNLGPGGRDMYRQALDHILPELGRIPLGKLTASDIDRYLTSKLQVPGRGFEPLGGTGTTAVWTGSQHPSSPAHHSSTLATRDALAPSTVHRHYRTLHRMLQVAVERGMIARNPAQHVQPPKIPRSQLAILDAGQVDALADHMPPRYRAWVYVAAYGGLRWSETVGLRRSNVDASLPPRLLFDRHGRSDVLPPAINPGAGELPHPQAAGATTRGGSQQNHSAHLRVVEQLVRRRDGTWDRCEPKTGQRRTVTLPGFAADILASHLEQYSAPGPDGLVFCTRTGGPLYGGSWNTLFHRALTKAGLPAVRPHDLRHSAASLAIAAGANIKSVQERLGHSSARVTLDIYAHLLPGADEAVAAGLDDLRAQALRAKLRAV